MGALVLLDPKQPSADVRVRAVFAVKLIAGTDFVTFRPALEDLHARAKREAALMVECDPDEIVILAWRFIT